MPKAQPRSQTAWKIPKHPTLIQRHLLARLKEFQPKGPVLAASLVLVGHPTHYLTCKQEGKTRCVYVPRDLLPEIRLWIQEHRRLKKLAQHLSQLALARIQTHVTDQRRKAGRS